MGGLACITKKKICNPPAFAAMQAPEDVITIYQSNPVYAEKYDRAGFEAYIYRCAALDMKTTTGYKEATDWFYQNVYRIEEGLDPLPAPWSTYVHHNQDNDNPDEVWNSLDDGTKRKLLSKLNLNQSNQSNQDEKPID